MISQSVLRDADPKWIYVGCVIPDIPWIIQRVIIGVVPGIDRYTLRFYFDVQASLAGSLLLCAAIAMFARYPGKIAALLGGNALLHLVLDASQTKWANGVHLLAPFSWDLTNWGLYWPESIVTYIMTGLGLVLFAVNWRAGVQTPFACIRPVGWRLVGLMLCLAAYLLLPLVLLHGPEQADNHYMRTLRTPESRAGRYVEFDRAYCKPVATFLECHNRQGIRVHGVELEQPASVSLRGSFINENDFYATESHVHHTGVRNSASYLGLALILMIWVIAGLNSLRALLTR